VEGSCEHGNELPDSITCWEILEWLSSVELVIKEMLEKVGEKKLSGSMCDYRRGLDW
jgi:hypothetical protein